MKTKIFLSASRLTVLALALLTSFCFNACSSDDDDNEPINSIVGTWIQEDSTDNVVEKITFWKNGTGYYECSLGIWAEFKYEVKNGKIIGEYVIIKSNYDDLKKGPFTWDYRIWGDKLILKIKDTIKDYEEIFTRVN